MSTKKKKVKRRKKTSMRKISKFQIKTFIFDMVKTTKKSEEIDDLVNPFLKTVNVKDEDKITVEQGEGYVRVSIIYKVSIDKV